MEEAADPALVAYSATANTVPGTYSSSIAIVKPRSGWFPRQRSETASSRTRSDPSASSAGTTRSV